MHNFRRAKVNNNSWIFLCYLRMRCGACSFLLVSALTKIQRLTYKLTFSLLFFRKKQLLRIFIFIISFFLNDQTKTKLIQANFVKSKIKYFKEIEQIQWFLLWHSYESLLETKNNKNQCNDISTLEFINCVIVKWGHISRRHFPFQPKTEGATADWLQGVWTLHKNPTLSWRKMSKVNKTWGCLTSWAHLHGTSTCFKL